MKLVGYFVVGEGKFGNYVYGQSFVSLQDATPEPELSGDSSWTLYWENRGYELVEVYVKEQL